MNIKEFSDYVADHIKDYLPEEYKNKEVRTWKQLKTNGQFYHALSLVLEKSGGIPVLYMENYFGTYLQGQNRGESVTECMERVMNQIGEAFTNAICEAEQVFKELNDVSSWKNLKEYVLPVVVNYERNAEMLQYIPHEQFLDLAISYKLIIEDVSAVVTNEVMKCWGVQKEELHKSAMENLCKTVPRIQKLTDFLLPNVAVLMPELDLQLYMISNEECYFGAAMMLNQEVLDRVCNMIGEECYVLPCSVHEILAVPKGKHDLKEQQSMVKEINTKSLEPEMYLSDNVYAYSRGRELAIGTSLQKDIQKTSGISEEIWKGRVRK